MNRVVLIGRLTKDPELKFTPGTGYAVATFAIAVDRRVPNKEGVREADFIPIVIWGKQAESTANYMSKGKLVGISGRIQTRSYDAKDGSKKYITEVVADEIQFLEWGKKNEGSNHNAEYEAAGITPVDDGDVPF
ncbi:single-stranded DNA-binding protein [Clostridium pasteurianum]|uniref:Single-stranded DNA-binding protein n=1 Tax=Clostridium pasteurianum BC1 TaxID=86416 RepID=R4K0U4_CLOPA|nr:single-stranded DNA-binding protein [Clostridium pasteurianum]AGK95391.1 single stranded DNA-binding protein [Clostridium pasteurianum BC1]